MPGYHFSAAEKAIFCHGNPIFMPNLRHYTNPGLRLRVRLWAYG
ncbi:hypothetical protein BV133_2414 [Blastochloris viridis]|uniref:Uncharacterized protein n=1 Tax=Blastochloris viridis TaxID=1079 RepID=A0A182D4Y5_BLAVI|nr:hypothetical protein BV133_2414 [Blastochloris viridis]